MNDLIKSDRIAISFSGGRTSAVMSKILVELYRDSKEICVVFANTGQEHEATLEFVDRCDREFSLNVVWVEAEVDMTHGKGVKHRVVDFVSASRDGRPFREYIAKYGIPNMATPQCTGRLKEDPIHHFLRKQKAWDKNSYETAIGIRADEIDRCSVNADKNKYAYPLVRLGYTKEKVVQEVRSWGFDLEIPGEHYGNCVWCWKKSWRKLLTVAKHNPEYFKFPARMERAYSLLKVSPATGSPNGHRLFFRKHKSTKELLQESQLPFEEFVDGFQIKDYDMDLNSGCGESCEIGTEEADRINEKIILEEGEWI